jgi:hypothetical protein
METPSVPVLCRAALCVCLCLCVYSQVGASYVGRPICVCAVLGTPPARSVIIRVS